MTVIDTLLHRHTETPDAAGSVELGGNLGAVAGGIGGLLAGLGVMAIPGLGDVLVGGWLMAGGVGFVAGAAAGMAGGSLIGEPAPHDYRYAAVLRDATRRPLPMNFASLS